MPSFSQRSKEKLETCDKRLQDICNRVIKELDISIISGHRGAVEQDTLYEQGFSKVQFPGSKHNQSPSIAVDVMLWNKEKPHIRWDDREQMSLVAGYMMSIASTMDIKLTWGGDWNGDNDTTNNWYDGGHFEIKE
jgi:peptidoglycan L-alanyl-D-glutamate endopeptidase CwlK